MHTLRAISILGTLVLAAACGDRAAVPPAATSAGAPAPGAGGAVYGEPLAAAETLTVADVIARAKELNGKPVRVEGTISDVCAKRGCWIRIADEASPSEITFKVQDGVMVFPMSAKGGWAVADGTVRRTELSVEDTRKRLAAEAEESGKPFDPASVKEPMVSVRLDGIGARVRDRK